MTVDELLTLVADYGRACRQQREPDADRLYTQIAAALTQLATRKDQPR